MYKPKRTTDFQRAACYAAERRAFPQLFNPKNGGGFTQEGMEKFFYVVKTSRYYMTNGGWQRVKISFEKMKTRAHYNGGRKPSGLKPGVVKFSNQCCTPWVVCHEMAHALTAATHPGASDHGGFFCRHYIELVRECIGEADAEKLEFEFNAGGLRVQSRESVQAAA